MDAGLASAVLVVPEDDLGSLTLPRRVAAHFSELS
jgi:hypothetical protein